MNPTQPPTAKRPKGYFRWPVAIVALILIQMSMAIGAVVLSTRNPSFGIVDNAYAKAMSWDEQAQAQAASDALGWTYQLRIGEPDPQGNRYLFFTLTDADGNPVEDATFTGTTYHRARPMHLLQFEFRQVTAGLYRTQASMHRDGHWVLDISATQHDHEFLIHTTVFVGQAPPPTP